jgi:hypothetical protein
LRRVEAVVAMGIRRAGVNGAEASAACGLAPWIVENLMVCQPPPSIAQSADCDRTRPPKEVFRLHEQSHFKCVARTGSNLSLDFSAGA